MGWAEKRSGGWRARWYDRDRKQKSASGFRTRADALDYASLRERFRVPDATVPPAEEQAISNDQVLVQRYPSGNAAVAVLGTRLRVSLQAHEWNGLVEIIRSLDGTPRPAAPVRSQP